MLNRQRPAPVADALLTLLQQDTTGLGLTTAELAHRMDRSLKTISAKLSKMRSYGQVERMQPFHFPMDLVHWKIRNTR